MSSQSNTPPLDLTGRDLVSITDLTRVEIEAILSLAADYEAALARGGRLHVLDGKLLATMFYEPSTRTRLSFESAMHRLGGSVISTAQARTSSSAVKGETVADAARVISGYADVIVHRHPARGSAREAADASSVPVINGGDGAGEHPTQALLDLYTIQREKGTIDGLRIAFIGDLRFGRSIHSLSKALALWDVSLILVSPHTLAMPAQDIEALQAQGVSVQTTDVLSDALAEADVAYTIRIQRERFEDSSELESARGAYYVLDRATVEAAKPGLAVMHPLPRVDGEIATDVDELPNAAYFRQAWNGVFARMALLSMLVGSTSSSGRGPAGKR
jgi:aspartate carbamoyltransferase catalytic subunit